LLKHKNLYNNNIKNISYFFFVNILNIYFKILFDIFLKNFKDNINIIIMFNFFIKNRYNNINALTNINKLTIFLNFNKKYVISSIVINNLSNLKFSFFKLYHYNRYFNYKQPYFVLDNFILFYNKKNPLLNNNNIYTLNATLLLRKKYFIFFYLNFE
jgi:hypothetical protein